ncbi:unnamed protein product [Clavelina lepadiformis]|uniref:Uncharacterized protein n=1 Tax=Clavelina lepadiformis TaxID=159417 RepID=A0ABP0H223_CLALP
MSTTPLESQNTDAMTFPANGITLTFLGAGDDRCFHCFDCSLVSGCTEFTFGPESEGEGPNELKLLINQAPSLECFVLIQVRFLSCLLLDGMTMGDLPLPYQEQSRCFFGGGS